jgi:phosphatidylinositol alpha-1,6-mannosyltransferase
VRRKGVLELVERVMPAVVARHPDVLLLIAGEDAGASLIHKSEPMSERIRAAVDGLRLGNQVRLLGRVGDADVQALMRCADVFVLNVLDLPGDVEGFGIVFLEAGVEGVPSVATRVGGIPDAVADGETGLLVDAGDDEALAGAVSTLLNDGELRVRLGRQAAARALERFTWPSIAQRYEEELERGEASVRSMRRMR